MWNDPRPSVTQDKSAAIETVFTANLEQSNLREAANVLTLIRAGSTIEFESDLKADPVALLCELLRGAWA